MTTTTPATGILTLGVKSAPSPFAPTRRLAIETALIGALFLVRTGGDIQQAATSANRASAMLNQTCADARTGGAA